MIPASKPDIGFSDFLNVGKALYSGWVSSKGKYVNKFEDNFRKYMGRRYAVTTSSGTAALHLALLALGITQGDEVIVPNLTFIATANAVSYVGAKPIFADIKKDTWNIDPEAILKKITPKTKALIVVHLFGNPCIMTPIKSIAEKYNLKIIEDCCQALGAPVGFEGDISCFSFYGNKLITTGEGGMCVTDAANLDYRMRHYRDHGMDPYNDYRHSVIGYNYRMTNLQAALGYAQMERIELFIKKRKKIYNLYRSLLLSHVKLQKQNKDAINWTMPILIPDRNKKSHLISQNRIEVKKFFYPLSGQKPYCKFETGLPNSCKISFMGVMLPMYTKMTKSQVKFVSKEVLEALR